MRNGPLLMLLGAALAALGAGRGGWAWAVVWLGGDFLLLGAAHALHRHGIFGKRGDGTLPSWSWALFLPLLAAGYGVWHVLRLASREAPINEVAPGVLAGRRLLPAEAGAAFSNYVDLTAEFSEPGELRRRAGYISLPILDGSAPRPDDLRRVIRGLRPGPTFIHCAQGHGRTGLFAAALLLESGAVTGADEALAMVRKARPGVRLNREQVRVLHEYARR